MRRMVVIGCMATAALAFSTLPSVAQYPPTPGADCAATTISTFTPWRVSKKNGVLVRVENHGSVESKCRVSLQITSGPAARVTPRRANLKLDLGTAAGVVFRVKPSSAGTYGMIACASSIHPAEAHPADDCVGAPATAS